jgi:predicted transcriptional regulator
MELQILSLLWEQGPMAIRAIREALPDGKDRAYTTVLTLVRIMEKKGFVAHTLEAADHARLDAKCVRRESGQSGAVFVGQRPAR